MRKIVSQFVTDTVKKSTKPFRTIGLFASKLTKTYMGARIICSECSSPLEGCFSCQSCLVRHCEETFQGSDNEEINTILKSSQSRILDISQVLEYIPFTNFNILDEIGRG